MQAQIAIGSTASYELRDALLVYRRDRKSNGEPGEQAFVTHHPVLYRKNEPPGIGPGSALRQESLHSLMDALQETLPFEFLPANVLARTNRLVAWWTPPSVRAMFYPKGEGKEMATLSGMRFPQPGLIFRTEGRSLSVRAVAGEERPTPETALFRAPYWNVGDRGAVCLGSANVPRDLAVSSIPLWERGFFESEFTHPNGAKRLTAHPSGFVGLWKELAGAPRFPREYLADAEQTVE